MIEEGISVEKSFKILVVGGIAFFAFDRLMAYFFYQNVWMAAFRALVFLSYLGLAWYLGKVSGY